MSSFILPLWAQRQGGLVELLQVLFVLLLFVVPTVLRFFAEKAAQKGRQRLEEDALEKQLHEAFNAAVAEASSEEFVVRPKPKPVKKRKRAELTLETDDDRPTRGSPLVRELAPQGEGSRFDASPGTFDSSLALTPSVEPTVQPTLESMTGIYDAPPGGEYAAQTPLAADIFQMLATPGGVQQAVVLSEIFRRPWDDEKVGR